MAWAVNYRFRTARLSHHRSRAKRYLTGWPGNGRDAHCLDCFAGSGALPRRRQCVMRPSNVTEMDRAVSQLCCKNLATLKSQQCSRRQYQYLPSSASRERRITSSLSTCRFVKGYGRDVTIAGNPWMAGRRRANLRRKARWKIGLPPVPANWALYREKAADRSLISSVSATQGENDAD